MEIQLHGVELNESTRLAPNVNGEGNGGLKRPFESDGSEILCEKRPKTDSSENSDGIASEEKRARAKRRGRPPRPKGSLPSAPKHISKRPRRDATGRTRLFKSARRGNLKDVQLLVKNGASVNDRDNAGWTPLHEAVLGQNAEVVKALLSAGADPNAKGLKGNTPLHDVDSAEYQQIARLLLKHGALVSATNDSGEAPITSDSAPEIKRIVEFYHKIELLLADNTTDDCGLNLLQRCCSDPSLHHFAFEFLKFRKTFPSSDNAGWTPLHEVALWGNTELGELLLRKTSLCVDDIGHNNMTSLQIALNADHIDFAAMLLRHGAKSDGISLPDELLNLKIPVEKRKISRDEKLTISYIARIKRAEEREMKRKKATKKKKEPSISNLLNLPIDPLVESAKNGDFIEAASLLKSHVPLQSLVSAISAAIKLGHCEIVRLMCEYVDTCTIDQHFLLHQAVIHGHADIVGYLVSKGASLGLRDSSGCSPLDLASQKNNMVAEILIDNTEPKMSETDLESEDLPIESVKIARWQSFQVNSCFFVHELQVASIFPDFPYLFPADFYIKSAFGIDSDFRVARMDQLVLFADIAHVEIDNVFSSDCASTEQCPLPLGLSPAEQSIAEHKRLQDPVLPPKIKLKMELFLNGTIF